MKTTIDLADDLLAEAKATAARRRTTLKAMVEHALRREIKNDQTSKNANPSYTIDEHGLPLIRKRGKNVVTSEQVHQIMEEAGI